MDAQFFLRVEGCGLEEGRSRLCSRAPRGPGGVDWFVYSAAGATRLLSSCLQLIQASHAAPPVVPPRRTVHVRVAFMWMDAWADGFRNLTLLHPLPEQEHVPRCVNHRAELYSSMSPAATTATRSYITVEGKVASFREQAKNYPHRRYDVRTLTVSACPRRHVSAEPQPNRHAAQVAAAQTRHWS